MSEQVSNVSSKDKDNNNKGIDFTFPPLCRLTSAAAIATAVFLPHIHIWHALVAAAAARTRRGRGRVYVCAANSYSINKNKMAALNRVQNMPHPLKLSED